jgi:phosphatidylglycerophosphatase B
MQRKYLKLGYIVAQFMIKRLFLIGLYCVLMLWLVIYVFEIAFSATQNDSYWTNIAYFITESGGTIGSVIGITIACLLYTIQEDGWKNKLQVFVKSFVGLALIIGMFAAINEKLTKPVLKLERPSHKEMLSRMQMESLVDSLYHLSKDERIAFFGLETEKRAELFKNINPIVLRHWVLEGGYSFPSGHTFNAFLLAMIFAFGIMHNTHKKHWQKLYPLPLLWATMVGISRVALGAHSIVDVSVGGLMGVCIGALLVHLDFTRHLITHKKKV